MQQREAENQVIDAVDRALAILECFSTRRPQLGVSEIGRELGMHKSTVFRSLASLEAHGLVVKDERTQRYALGPKTLKLAAAYLSTVSVREKAMPWMERLRAETNETITLYLRAGDRSVCIERLESHLEVRRVINVGDSFPLHAGSTGKVFLAYMPEPVRRELLSRGPLQPFAPSTITDPARLEAELTLVRERGFAISHQERALGASGVSAPIFGITGEVTAALSISGPSDRFAGELECRYAELVRQAAAQVSMHMGHNAQTD